MNYKLDNKRRIDRPKIRFIIDVGIDLGGKKLVRNWRQKAEDRVDWHALVREIKGKLKHL